MAFSNVNAGIVAGPSHSNDLFRTLYSTEVRSEFETKAVMKGKHFEMTIDSGKSYEFPAIGGVTASYHQPGQWINGQGVNHGKTVLLIDDLLIADVFVSGFEEKMNHYETRAKYRQAMAYKMAQIYDQHLFALATKACQVGLQGPVPELGPASEISIGADADIEAFYEGIIEAATVFDETDVPDEDRYCFVTPRRYQAMVKDGRYLNHDFGNSGNGSQYKGTIMEIDGMKIVKTNNLKKNFGTEPDNIAGTRAGVVHDEYTVDGRDTEALIMQKDAIGTVHLQSFATEDEYMTARQGTLLVTKSACGHTVLRPECLTLVRGN